jgi:CRP-like cAMP-binding protein/Ca2+-binding EF-hand superfamily protein
VRRGSRTTTTVRAPSPQTSHLAPELTVWCPICFTVIHFEFAHLLIFFWACVYTTSCLVSSFRLRSVQSSWDRVSQADTETLCSAIEKRLLSPAELWAKIKEDAAGIGLTSLTHPQGAMDSDLRPDQIMGKLFSGNGKGSWRVSWIALLPGANTGYEDVEWKIMQRLFLRNFKLPPDFDYSKYLRQKLMDSLAESLEVTPLIWFLVIGMVIFFQLLSLTWGSFQGDQDPHNCMGGVKGVVARRRLDTLDTFGLLPTEEGALDGFAPMEVFSLLAAVLPGASGRRQLAGGGDDDDPFLFFGLCCKDCGKGKQRRQLGGGGASSGDDEKEWCKEECAECGGDIPVKKCKGYNATAFTRRRQLGGGGGAGKPLSKAGAQRITWGMVCLGWTIVLANSYVLGFIKHGIHKLMKHQNLKEPSEAALFLRRLDAQLEVRLQMSKIKMFQEGGDDFHNTASQGLKVTFGHEGDYLAKEGDSGDSMFFIVAGNIDIVSEFDEGRPTLATLGPGDFCGEMSLLLSIERSKSLVISSEEATIAVMDQEQLDSLEDSYSHVIDQLRQTAQTRLKMTSIDSVKKVKTPRAKTTSPKHGGHGHGHKHSGAKLPGMGHHHHRGSKMIWAEEILSNKVKKRFTVFSQLFLLLNCFYLSFYLGHVSFIVVPRAGYGSFGTFLVHTILIIPSILVMFYLAPVQAKYQCLLSNVLERDDELIAHVTSERSRMLEIRNKMRTAMMHMGIKIAHDNELEPEDITAYDVAKFAFQMLDADGGGTLSYKELREGLPEFGIFLDKKEFQAVCRLIDPDSDGQLDMKEWLDFMQATDDDLMGGEWQGALEASKLRKKIKDALYEPALALYWETAPTGAEPPTVAQVVAQIFQQLDEDGNETLDYLELKTGLEMHDVVVSADEFRLLLALVDHNHKGDVTLAMFHQLMEMTGEIAALLSLSLSLSLSLT